VFPRTGGAIWWKLTEWRFGVVDWSGGVFASCMPRVQLYVNACNGWPQFALQHHWLLPINCHFLRLYSAAGRGIAAVSSALEESDLYLYSSFLSRLPADKANHRPLPLTLIDNCLNALQCSVWFSTLNLGSGYYNIPHCRRRVNVWSCMFSLKFGVRQGSVLSPFCFPIMWTT